LSDIYGIWFYEKTDCEKVGRKVEQLVQEVEARLQARQAAAAGGGDLAQMLQVRYDTISGQCCGSGSLLFVKDLKKFLKMF
jgi:hypothetical protein